MLAFHALWTRSEVQWSNTNDFSYTSHSVHTGSNVFFQWLRWWSRYFSLIVLGSQSLVLTAGQFFVEYTWHQNWLHELVLIRTLPVSHSRHIFFLVQWVISMEVNFLFIKSSWSNYTAGNFSRTGLNWFDFKGAKKIKLLERRLSDGMTWKRLCSDGKWLAPITTCSCLVKVHCRSRLSENSETEEIELSEIKPIVSNRFRCKIVANSFLFAWIRLACVAGFERGRG